MVLGISMLAIYSAQPAYATIYWDGGSASDGFFVPKLNKLGMNAVFGGPVTMNGNDGHYIVLQAEQNVPDMLNQLKDQFPELSEKDISTGNIDSDALYCFHQREQFHQGDSCSYLIIKIFS